MALEFIDGAWEVIVPDNYGEPSAAMADLDDYYDDLGLGSDEPISKIEESISAVSSGLNPNSAAIGLTEG